MTIEEVTGEQLLSSLEHGAVVLESETAEDGTAITVRKSNDTYYCDTSIKLYTYGESSELLSHLEGLGISIDRPESCET